MDKGMYLYWVHALTTEQGETMADEVRDGGPYLDVEQELEAEKRRAKVENREPDFTGILADSNWVPNSVEPSDSDDENPEGDLPPVTSDDDTSTPASGVDLPKTENPPL